MDNILLITLLLVFLTALISTYVSRRSRERVLKDFHAYHVTVELIEGKLIWGALSVFASGLELLFARPHDDPDTPELVKMSYIMPQAQLADVRAIYRYHDELSPEKQKRRLDEIEKTYKPGFFRRLTRHLRNFINTFRDAVNESIGILLVRMKGTNRSMVLQSQEQRLQRMSQTALGSLNNAYDPILERYIGHRVVIEWQEGQPHELAGILKEYSPDWLSVLDCRIAREYTFGLEDPERLRLYRNLDFSLMVRRGTTADQSVELEICIENHGPESVRIKRLEAEAYERSVDRLLESGDVLEEVVRDLPASLLTGVRPGELPWQWRFVAPERVSGSDEQAGDEAETAVHVLSGLRFVFEAFRQVDICVPRAQAVVRHGGERID